LFKQDSEERYDDYHFITNLDMKRMAYVEDDPLVVEPLEEREDHDSQYSK